MDGLFFGSEGCWQKILVGLGHSALLPVLDFREFLTHSLVIWAQLLDEEGACHFSPVQPPRSAVRPAVGGQGPGVGFLQLAEHPGGVQDILVAQF